MIFDIYPISNLADIQFQGLGVGGISALELLENYKDQHF